MRRPWALDLLAWLLLIAVLFLIGLYPPVAFGLPVAVFAWLMYLAREQRLWMRMKVAAGLLAVMAFTLYFLLNSNGDTSSLTPVDQPADYREFIQGEP